MPPPVTLDDWLAHCERLHPAGIDMTLSRVTDIRQRLGLTFPVPVFTVAGTNGKGSTCAMLEAIALQAGYRVGLYTKPHFVHFEERCRVNGEMVSAQQLIPHFEAIEQARGTLALTYFEFTTLAIMRLLSQAEVDLVILEVGLGGRLDAVNVIDTDCAIITSIDLDHTEYLGPDRESIGREKAAIMRPGKPVIVSDPVPPSGIAAHALALGAEVWQSGRDFTFSGGKQQWDWSGRRKRFNALAYPALRGANQLLNAAGVLAAFEALGELLPITAQAVRSGLAMVRLPGRFQIVPGQPTLVLDVAHNPHAVATLMQNLNQMGFHPRTHAVFGVMSDKDIASILLRMAPIVDNWYFCDLPLPRAATAAQLEAAYRQLASESTAGMRGPGPVSLHRHTAPLEALQAVLAQADRADRIVVFGSFHTVGEVLKNGLPRLAAQHVA